MKEIIKNVEKVHGLKLGVTGALNGTNGSRLGMTGMISGLCGYDQYDGYKIESDQNVYLVLIDNGQSCCESWGYFSSEDDFQKFTGKELKEVRLTDTALNQKLLEDNNCEYGFDQGGIQFVDFVMADGYVLQFAVYNGHNGYYGHSILIAKNNEIMLSDTL